MDEADRDRKAQATLSAVLGRLLLEYVFSREGVVKGLGPRRAQEFRHELERELARKLGSESLPDLDSALERILSSPAYREFMKMFGALGRGATRGARTVEDPIRDDEGE